MTSFVVDASVVIQYLVEEEHSDNVKNLFQSIMQGNMLVFPEFGLLECTNVLWKHVRFHGVNQQVAKGLVQALLNLDIMVTPATSLMPRALDIGLRHQLAIYDSIYIALAEHLNYPLITVDKRQSLAAQGEGIVLRDIRDFKS